MFGAIRANHAVVNKKQQHASGLVLSLSEGRVRDNAVPQLEGETLGSEISRVFDLKYFRSKRTHWLLNHAVYHVVFISFFPCSGIGLN